MNKLKRFIVFAAVFCMLAESVYAETKELSHKLALENENVAVVADSLSADKDYSDLYVDVIKDTDRQQKTIYSGALRGYADGAFADVGFPGINFMVLFDCNTMASEAIYIVPSTAEAAPNTLSLNADANTSSEENTVELQNTISTATIQTNMSLMYNNKYCESVLLPGQTLTIPVTVTNMGDTSVEIVPYIAKYDLSGRLTDLTQGSLIIAPAHQTITATLTNEFNNDTACTAKVFMWKKSNLEPVSDSIYITIQNHDYYVDTYTEANKIDIDKQLCGVINTSTDIDIIKFTSSATGLYALQLDASSGTICGLYDSSQTLLNSVSAVTDKNYLLYSLTANQDYYIRFNGAENNSYEITPALPSELTTLTKNIGTASCLTNSSDYDVYKFTPTTTGNYVITAVDSSSIKADLYNSSFTKVASSDVSDTAVSFRITNNMTANETYYIVVYPKTKNALGSYTMYVEEPFNLISIE